MKYAPSRRYAAAGASNLEKGDLLVAIDEESTRGMTLKQMLHVMSIKSRPVQMTFQHQQDHSAIRAPSIYDMTRDASAPTPMNPDGAEFLKLEPMPLALSSPIQSGYA